MPFNCALKQIPIRGFLANVQTILFLPQAWNPLYVHIAPLTSFTLLFSPIHSLSRWFLIYPAGFSITYHRKTINICQHYGFAYMIHKINIQQHIQLSVLSTKIIHFHMTNNFLFNCHSRLIYTAFIISSVFTKIVGHYFFFIPFTL